MKNNKADVRIRTNHPKEKEGFPESPAIVTFEKKPSNP